MSKYKTVATNDQDESLISLSSPKKSSISVSAPVEFGGVDYEWSPEDLFSASISSCFILTFKAISKTKKMSWDRLEVEVVAHLEKKDKGLKFTKVEINATLKVCCSLQVDDYLLLLEKSKRNCLVTNSMNCEFALNPKVIVKAK